MNPNTTPNPLPELETTEGYGEGKSGEGFDGDTDFPRRSSQLFGPEDEDEDEHEHSNGPPQQ